MVSLEFEKKVLLGLNSCGIKGSDVLGVAVSGGADSISLLTSLVHLKKENVYKDIIAVTINHNIRPHEETYGDVEFTTEYCKSLGIECVVYSLQKGEVEKCAEKRGGGIEEAARFLRYQCFEDFADKHRCNAICLAHNLNDRLETILQRVFQGAGSQSVTGIPRVRGIYCRPLLDISRFEIEQYLSSLHQSFCVDKTNSDNTYLRNKFRNLVVPFLNETLLGWDGALLRLAQRADDDDNVISSLVDKIQWTQVDDSSCKMKLSIFDSQYKAIQVRLLYKAISIVLASDNSTSRVSYSMLSTCCEKRTNVSGNGIEILRDNDDIVVKKSTPYMKERCFFGILQEIGVFSFPFGEIQVVYSSFQRTSSDSRDSLVKLVCGEKEIGPFTLPVIIRSAGASDVVEASGGKTKTLKKLFTDYHIQESKKGSVPIIESLDGKIIAVWGDVVGYPNWYVK